MSSPTAAKTHTHLKSLMKKNMLRILMPALFAGMALMSALAVRANAPTGQGIFIFTTPRNSTTASAAGASPLNPNAHKSDIAGVVMGLLTRFRAHASATRHRHKQPDAVLNAARGILTAADGRAAIHAGGDVRTDMRIKAADVQHSRPDRMVDRNLEDFVASLSGMELLLLVLAIVLPLSIVTPLLAILLLGRRCEKCGRLRAMRDTTHRRHDEGAVTKNGRPIYRYVVTRTCRHCGHTDDLEQARN